MNLADEDDFHGTDYFGTSQTVWDNDYNTNFADIAPIHKAKRGLVNPNAEDGRLFRMVGS